MSLRGGPKGPMWQSPVKIQEEIATILGKTKPPLRCGAAVWGSNHQQVDEVADIAQQHGEACPAGQLLAFQSSQPDEDAGGDGNQHINAEVGGEGNIDDHGGQANHEQNVEDVGTDNVADGNVGVALPGGGDGGEQLGQGSTQSDHGQADETLGHAEDGSQLGGSADGHICAPDDQSQTDQGGQQHLPNGHVLDLVAFLIGVQGFPDHVADISGEQGDQHQTVDAGDGAVPAQQQENGGNGDHEGDVDLQGGLAHGDGDNGGSQTQNDQDIQNVGADDVADGDVGAAAHGGGDGDSSLGGAGAHGHDGQADDDLGDAELGGDAGGTVNEPVGTLDQHDEAQDQQAQLQNDLHCYFLLKMLKMGAKKRDSCCDLITTKSRRLLGGPDFSRKPY